MYSVNVLVSLTSASETIRKGAACRSPNCMRKTRNMLCAIAVILWKTASSRKISQKPGNRPSTILNFRNLEFVSRYQALTGPSGIAVQKLKNPTRPVQKLTILKLMFIFRYPKLLYRISEIFISDIQNNYSGYQKLCQKGVLFEISKKVILDIKNNNFGYPKINSYFAYQKLLFWISEIVISDIWNSL